MEDVLGSDAEEEGDSDRIEVIDADAIDPGDDSSSSSSAGEPGGGAPARAVPPDDAELRTALEERDKYHDLWIRARADFENYSKRVERESEDRRKRAGSDVMERILPVLDNLERALADRSDGPAFREGISLISRQLFETLADLGLEPIQAVGEPFDPVYHEAVATERVSDRPPNTVLEEVQKGYMFKGRVLRHSMVRVAVAPGGEEPGAETAEGGDP